MSVLLDVALLPIRFSGNYNGYNDVFVTLCAVNPGRVFRGGCRDRGVAAPGSCCWGNRLGSAPGFLGPRCSAPVAVWGEEPGVSGEAGTGGEGCVVGVAGRRICLGIFHMNPACEK